MILQNRDLKIIDFIETCPTNIDVIKELFFTSYTAARRRMKILYDNGYVKRAREDIASGYIYFVGNAPKQINHMMKISQFYMQLMKYAEILNCQTQVEIKGEGIRPDVYAVFRYKGDVFRVFVEVELSNNPYPKIKAYEKIYQKRMLRPFPIVLYITNKRNVESNIIPIFKVDLDFSNFALFLDTIPKLKELG